MIPSSHIDMDLDASTSATASFRLISAPISVGAWSLGQRLPVIVLTSGNQGLVRLQTPHGVLEANTRFPVKAGQQFVLQVVGVGEKTVMKVLERSPMQESIDLTRALRTLLPQQLGLPPLLANLGTIIQTAATIPFSAALLDAIKALIKALPSLRQVSTPHGLRQALFNSGLFLEAKLAKEQQEQPSALSADLKTVLLVLRRALLQDGAVAEPCGLAANSKQYNREASPLPIRGTTPYPQPRAAACISPQSPLDKVINVLANQVDGALARLQLNQIASISLAKDHPLEWLFELPICRDSEIDILTLRIEESKEKRSKEKNRQSHTVEHVNHWVATLAVDIDTLGPLQAKIIVCAQQVTVDLWVEQPQAVGLFNSTFNLLTASLKQDGMTPMRLACHLGAMPKSTHPKNHSTLLSIRA